MAMKNDKTTADRKVVDKTSIPYVPAAKGERAEAVALRWFRSGHLEEGIKALANEDYRRACAIAVAAGIEPPAAPAGGTRGRKAAVVGVEIRLAITRVARDDGRKSSTCRVPLDAFGAGVNGAECVAVTLNADGTFTGRLVSKA